jgi:hypothetical protein
MGGGARVKVPDITLVCCGGKCNITAYSNECSDWCVTGGVIRHVLCHNGGALEVAEAAVTLNVGVPKALAVQAGGLGSIGGVALPILTLLPLLVITLVSSVGRMHIE